MKILLMQIVCVLAFGVANDVVLAQSKFQRTIDFASDLFNDDVAYWAEQLPDASYIVLAGPNDSDTQNRVIKLGAAGAIEWSQDNAPVGSTGAAPSHIIPSLLGGYALTSYHAVGGSSATYIVRLDNNGIPTWTRKFQTASPTGSGAYTIGPAVDEVPVAAGGYVVAGQEIGQPALHRLSDTGGIWFTKRYINISVPPIDARGAFNDVHALTDGFIAVGWLNVPPSQMTQAFVLRTDLAGDVLWAKTYRQQLPNTAWGVDLASNGDFLISGYTKDAAEGGGTSLIRIDANGMLVFHKWFVGIHGNRAIEELPDGNILLGATVINAFNDRQTGALLTDANGNYLACWAFGSMTNLIDFGRCALPTHDGGFAVLGQTDSFGPPGDRDIYFIKLDAATAAGTSDCHEVVVLLKQTEGECLPHDEFFEIESDPPSFETMTSNTSAMAATRLCCPEDVDGNSVIDVIDLLAVLAAWLQAGGPADVNGDGVVNILDLLAVLAAWGECD